MDPEEVQHQNYGETESMQSQVFGWKVLQSSTLPLSITCKPSCPQGKPNQTEPGQGANSPSSNF